LKPLKPHPDQLSLAFDPAPSARPRRNPEGTARLRRAQTGAAIIEYRLRRARRRTIGFQIDDEGLTISAPRWVTLAEIDAAVAEKSRWIADKQREWRAWRARQPLPILTFSDGARLPYLGRTIILRLQCAAATTLITANDELHLALPRHATEHQVRDGAQSWLQGEARRIFGARIARFADRIAPNFAGWQLSSARSQWGSCTHDGRVRLNWRLVHFAVPVIDYVIAHELAHLHELNHGPRFWRAVERLLPGFEAARDEIKDVDIASLPL
jgi:predicted metal-dependent hydrolase